MPALTEVRDPGSSLRIAPAPQSLALPRLKAGATMEGGSQMSVQVGERTLGGACG